MNPKRAEWESRWPPSTPCAGCGHTFALHAIDTAGAKCSLYAAFQGQPFTRCPCPGFTAPALADLPKDAA